MQNIVKNIMCKTFFKDNGEEWDNVEEWDNGELTEVLIRTWL